MSYAEELAMSEEMARLDEENVLSWIEYMEDGEHGASITPSQEAACIEYAMHIVDGMRLPF